MKKMNVLNLKMWIKPSPNIDIIYFWQRYILHFVFFLDVKIYNICLLIIFEYTLIAMTTNFSSFTF
jgi:hypothetical protein